MSKELQPDETLLAYWEYPQAINAYNRLLKPYGVKIKVRANYSQWGDQIAVRVERMTKPCKS